MSTTADGTTEILALSGTDLGHTDWMDITQDRVDTFANATNDHQWIHTDPNRAATGPFGGTIAHGYLTLSLVIPLFNDLLTISGVSMSINYGLNKVRFPTPVPVGSKIRLHGTVAEATEVSGGAQTTVDFTIEIQGTDKPACIAQAVYRHYT